MDVLDPGDPTELAEAAGELFEALFDGTATCVAQAPGRVNLMGEHTDYNRGLVLPLALRHATYAAVASRTDGRVRIATSHGDETWTGTVDAVGPGEVSGWATYVAGVLWAMREDGFEVPGVDVLVHSTVPLGAGLSSSAALECSVALAVCGVLDVEATPAVRRRLRDACIRAESEVAGAPTGGMDQTVSLLAEAGAALLIDFDDDTSRPVPLELGDAGLTLLVTDTRVSHSLVDGGYAARRADCEAAAAALGVPSLRGVSLDQAEGLSDDRVMRRARHIVTEVARVSATVDALAGSDWTDVGRIFLASHLSMRDDFEISCPELDLAVTFAVEAGAIGARMTGGGFGGSSIALVPEERIDAVMRAIDLAFGTEGFRPPAHLLADPAAAADLIG